MKVGYARVSTTEQHEDRQLRTLEELGAEKTYIDKLSGKDTNRPQLNEMLEFVREGDTVIVSEYSRLARSTKDL
ncbi:MAG: recombinase family protein, partial [Lachnospiraceae bacterium]|nr:recombinase family protein [Lachnospiraceae bacterium]